MSNNYKLKRRIFIFFGTLTILLELFLAGLVFYGIQSIQPHDGVFLKWIMPSIVSLFALSLLFIAGLFIPGGGEITINLGEVFLLIDNTKPVYHSELGYFLLIFVGDEARLYRQNYLHLKFLKEFKLTDSNTLAKQIKNYLDILYQGILNRRNIEHEINKKLTEIDKWDGFLDAQGKREEKLKQLLK